LPSRAREIFLNSYHPVGLNLGIGPWSFSLNLNPFGPAGSRPAPLNKEFTFVIAGLLRDLPRFGWKHNLPQHLIDLRPKRLDLSL
jgi:hypothetical protein